MLWIRHWESFMECGLITCPDQIFLNCCDCKVDLLFKKVYSRFDVIYSILVKGRFMDSALLNRGMVPAPPDPL